ncbi:MAG: aldo/keto reductase [Abitibacteriaceae bacterium]|nr:aldo/keto reductase [Abditibacteriaceae bacterium]MBV9866018.1 aldo/keto reductase [Abditibacteriaceae bacterium]
MVKRYGDRLPRRRLGRSQLRVPALALGGAGLGGAGLATRGHEVNDKDGIETVRYALEQGINYIDTSPLYGESERRIGLALEGVPRDSYILSSKTGTHPQRRGDYSWDGTLWSVENSLKLLKTDFIDLLLVHDPNDIEPVFAPRGALEALEELKTQGVIKSIGLGQRNHDFHRRAIESGRFDVILTYNDYHPLRTTAADWLLPLAAQHDVGVLNGAVLEHGMLAGNNADYLNNPTWQNFPARELAAARRLYAWCNERDIPVQALAFQMSLRQPLIHCTLTGAKTRAELEQNLEAATIPLPENVWEELEALNLTAGQQSS